MKIGIFDPYLDDLGGGEKYMMTIAQCLSKDHQVSVFWDNTGDIKILLERFSIDLSKVRFTKNIFSPKVSLITRLLETRKYDAIIILSDGSIPFVLSRKLLLHFQQPMQHISYISLATRQKLQRVNTIFCNSNFTKSYIDKTFNKRSHVVYPPIELHPKSIRKEPIILHVGRFRVKDVTVNGKAISDYKKQAFMVEAFKRLIKNGLKDWKFILAVSIKEKEKSAFEELKKEAGVFPVEFLINKNNNQLWDFYSRASIYWHASGYGEDLEKNPECAEHFGIATVEAMGAGAVPVVINAGGQKEIVEDGENGFLWNTLDELQTKTMKVIKDNALWRKLSEGAQKRAQYFAGNRFCDEVEKLLT